MMMGWAEYLPLLIYTPIGILLGYSSTYKMKKFPLTRRVVFGSFVFAFINGGFLLGLRGALYKL